MAVDLLLDNPQIALRQVGNGDPTMTRARARAISPNLGEGFYLDFPGDSLRPGCLYEQDHNRFNAGQPAVVYAHVAQQPDRPDLLALQYWLFWYYNDWNNKHEGDWEFVQLLFPASTVAEALATDPVSVGYAQHEGGERADWTDDKLEREGGTHPVVYSSQRSHASYSAPPSTWARSGVRGVRLRRHRGALDQGRAGRRRAPGRGRRSERPARLGRVRRTSGERHAAPNNGPTGPNTKPQWTRARHVARGPARQLVRRPDRRHAGDGTDRAPSAAWSSRARSSS